MVSIMLIPSALVRGTFQSALEAGAAFAGIERIVATLLAGGTADEEMAATATARAHWSASALCSAVFSGQQIGEGTFTALVTAAATAGSVFEYPPPVQLVLASLIVAAQLDGILNRGPAVDMTRDISTGVDATLDVASGVDGTTSIEPS
jgi:hypothetical protein